MAKLNNKTAKKQRKKPKRLALRFFAIYQITLPIPFHTPQRKQQRRT